MIKDDNRLQSPTFFLILISIESNFLVRKYDKPYSLFSEASRRSERQQMPITHFPDAKAKEGCKAQSCTCFDPAEALFGLSLLPLLYPWSSQHRHQKQKSQLFSFKTLLFVKRFSYFFLLALLKRRFWKDIRIIFASDIGAEVIFRA